MQIGVTTDVARAMKGLKRLEKKQLPFAAALGLTNIAKKLAQTEQRMTVKQLDRPTHRPRHPLAAGQQGGLRQAGVA